MQTQIDGVPDDLRALRGEVEQSDEADRLISTRAMSWQIVGLLVAGCGALLTALAG